MKAWTFFRHASGHLQQNMDQVAMQMIESHNNASSVELGMVLFAKKTLLVVGGLGIQP